MARTDARFFIVSEGQAGETLDEDAFYESGRGFVRWILSVLPPTADVGRGRALDIGCGLGRNTFALAEHFGEAVGLDIADDMVGAANASARRPANARAALIGPDARFPVDDRSVDFALSVICFQHIPSWGVIERALAETGRLLVPGGVAALHFDTRPASPARTLYMALPDAVLPAVHRRGMRRVPRAAGRVRAALERIGLTVLGERDPDSAAHWFFVRR